MTADLPGSAPAKTVAGVDLGSNSFHMVIVRRERDGKIQVLDKLREPVRLAAGLDRHRDLTLEAQRRGWSALEKMGERLRALPSRQVRAVGTNTLRQARNGHDFLQRGAELLGHPIEIISGPEEARLIFLGVAHSDFIPEGKRLVIDIGGGSTELIIGEGYEPIDKHSLYMGCVSFSMRFFSDDKLTPAAFEAAELAAAKELRSIRETFRQLGWDFAFGASGTIRSLDQVARANGWSQGDLDLAALGRIREELVRQRKISKLELRGLEPDRAPVIAGGLAVLTAAFRSLGIEGLQVATGALREGLAFELLGERSRSDVRGKTVAAFEERYHVDRAHASRCETTALHLFEQVATPWGIDESDGRRMLRYAVRLHEIGLSISYAGFHKHDAYIIENAEMPGFSRDEQDMLAAILRGHRRKLRPRYFKDLPPRMEKPALQLSILVRLAVTLHRSRTSEPMPDIRVERADADRLELVFPPHWLDRHPLVRTDLEGEAQYLERAGVTLEVA
jgi:exopolyphosphatase/guanosine-5'-triphosphate,3'-diphosphate pyrophosphatase